MGRCRYKTRLDAVVRLVPAPTLGIFGDRQIITSAEGDWFDLNGHDHGDRGFGGRKLGFGATGPSLPSFPFSDAVFPLPEIAIDLEATFALQTSEVLQRASANNRKLEKFL